MRLKDLISYSLTGLLLLIWTGFLQASNISNLRITSHQADQVNLSFTIISPEYQIKTVRIVDKSIQGKVQYHPGHTTTETVVTMSIHISDHMPVLLLPIEWNTHNNKIGTTTLVIDLATQMVSTVSEDISSENKSTSSSKESTTLHEDENSDTLFEKMLLKEEKKLSASSLYKEKTKTLAVEQRKPALLQALKRLEHLSAEQVALVRQIRELI